MTRVIAGLTTSLDGFVADESGSVDRPYPDCYVGNYEIQVPIFVLTHHPPRVAPKQDEHLTFTFVAEGVESAVARAKAAAGKKVLQ